MTIYDIDREDIGNETEARIQKDGSLDFFAELATLRNVSLADRTGTQKGHENNGFSPVSAAALVNVFSL